MLVFVLVIGKFYGHGERIAGAHWEMVKLYPSKVVWISSRQILAALNGWLVIESINQSGSMQSDSERQDPSRQTGCIRRKAGRYVQCLISRAGNLNRRSPKSLLKPVGIFFI